MNRLITILSFALSGRFRGLGPERNRHLEAERGQVEVFRHCSAYEPNTNLRTD